MRMWLAKKMLLGLLCFKSGGVLTLKSKTMLRKFLNLALDLKHLSQSKPSVSVKIRELFLFKRNKNLYLSMS